jgi:hypothetical protein
VPPTGGVVARKIEASERVYDPVDHAGDRFLVADVSRYGDRLAARGSQIVDELLETRAVPRRHRDGGASATECTRDGGSNAAARTRHECNLSRQIGHDVLQA